MFSGNPMRQITAVLIFSLALLQVSSAANQSTQVRKSLVRISAAAQQPDFKTPWNPGRTARGVGAGFVIEGNRLMTNAHIVSNVRFLSVEKDGDPRKYVAEVQHIGHDCDLAVLSVTDPGFFDGTVALEFDELPAIETTVSAYGYPIGGDRLSVTRGVVSRIDFRLYAHSGSDAHLAIQIDAAINPGNSGGPVLQGGEVVGVAFQGYSGAVAQNVGYMIPVPVIKRFLKDIEDGHYDRYVDLSITTFKLLNPAHRKALGLPDDDRGVMVSTVFADGSSEGVLERGDVLLRIDDHPIESDGSVELEGERVEMPEIVERKFLGDEVRFHILRDGKPLDVKMTLKPAWPFSIQSRLYDVKPRYVTFAGLVFQPLTRNFMEVYKPNDLRLNYFYNSYVAKQLYVERPQVIVLSSILPDPINTYVRGFRYAIIEEINGRKIKTLEDVAEAFTQESEFHVIRLLGEGRPIVLEGSKAAEANERIRKTYNVFSLQNLDATIGD